VLQGWEWGRHRQGFGPQIREYFIPDFSRWKNQEYYQPAFDRLLRDLKNEDADAVPA
jgi:hypothetical protein